MWDQGSGAVSSAMVGALADLKEWREPGGPLETRILVRRLGIS